jgi:hypothetical protein
MPTVSNDHGGPYQRAGLHSASTQRGEPFSGANFVFVNDRASQPSGRVSAKGAVATALTAQAGI